MDILLQHLTIKAVIKGEHKEISCEDGNVVPHEVLFQTNSWRNEGLTDELEEKKDK